MTYTLLVLLAAFLARGRARGSAGVARAMLAGAIMLAPQLGDGTQTLLLALHGRVAHGPIRTCPGYE